MNATARGLIEKLLRTKPKPSEEAMRELFMAIQGSTVEELLQLCQSRVSPSSKRPASELESQIKRELRKIGGKAADYVPYLLKPLHDRGDLSGVKSNAKLPTLSKAVALLEASVGGQANTLAMEALDAYAVDHDASYRLKSA